MNATAATVSAECRGCESAQRQSRREQKWVRCAECGQEYLVEATAELKPKAQKRKPALSGRPDQDSRLIRIFVNDLLRWAAAVARVEREAHGNHSPILAVIHAMRDRIVGTGCYGTKGIGHAPANDLDYKELAIDPIVAARYQTLTGDHSKTADAIIDDGQGDQVVSVAFGDRTLDLGLFARVGWRLADQRQAERWEAKILAKDSRAALAGAENLGNIRIIAAAKAWIETAKEG